VTYAESPPYDTATFTGATVVRDRQWAVGGNVGVEAGWRFTAHVGVAAVGRYSRSTADFSAENAEVVLGGLRPDPQLTGLDRPIDCSRTVALILSRHAGTDP
jgi:hypothetical protein